MTRLLSRASALAGAVVWLGLWFRPLPGSDDARQVARVLLLAILVLVPLALELVVTPDRYGRPVAPGRLACGLQPVGAALAVASFFVGSGARAGLLASAWLLFALLVAGLGLRRLLARGLVRAEEVCIDAGLIYLPVGAAWLVLARMGARPMGFGGTIVLLTAMHFHYAGFFAPLLAGLAGRQGFHFRSFPGKDFRLIAAGVGFGPAVVAAGIASFRWLEVAGVLVLAAALIGLALLMALAIAPRLEPAASKAAIVVSAAALVFAMAFACAYGVGKFVGGPAASIGTMVRFHGWVNACGFVLPALLAWLAIRPQPHVAAPGTPFSLLRSSGRVGAGYFERSGATAANRPHPRGLVDTLDEFARPDFPVHAVHPAVRSFYEDTLGHGLVVRAEWAPVFRLAGRVYKWVSSRLEQMNFPLAGETTEDEISSRIVAVEDAVDGRRNVRGWVRTYRSNGKAVYVAAYSAHSLGAEVYSNIAFPLPGGNLASILRWEAIESSDGAGGVLLTTFPRPQRVGDEGVYFVNRAFAARLPFNETIRVWPAPAQPAPGTSDNASALARHDVWLFGFRFLTLRYEIFPTSTRAG
jgi:YndJ-like protein